MTAMQETLKLIGGRIRLNLPVTNSIILPNIEGRTAKDAARIINEFCGCTAATEKNNRIEIDWSKVPTKTVENLSNPLFTYEIGVRLIK